MSLSSYVQYKSVCTNNEQALITAVMSDYPQYLGSGSVAYLLNNPVINNTSVSFIRYENSGSWPVKSYPVNLSLPLCDSPADFSGVNLSDFGVVAFLFFCFLLGLVAGLRGHGRTV